MTLLQRLIDFYAHNPPRGPLDHSEPERWPGTSRRRAAVLIPVTDHLQEPELVLTRRAMHLSSHPGQISFPGGMWEPEDNDLTQTALRESHEEIGLRPGDVKLLNRFHPKASRFGVEVTPFLGIIPRSANLTACTEETDEIIPVPLVFFLDQEPERFDYRETNGVHYRLPSWRYQGQEIWGLTAMIIEEMLEPLK